MSLGSLLSVARTALNVHQSVIQTAGHNITNSETEGFSRQRVELKPNGAQTWSYGSVGTGVLIGNVTRARDRLLDTSFRTESSTASAATLRHGLLGAVESVLGEPGEEGLASAMDAFWASWSDLASEPTSGAARAVVKQRGANVAMILNGFDARLRDLRDQTTESLTNAVGDLNALADHVASLNGRIVESEVNGTSANDLRDERDRALDRLAKLGDVRTIEARDGSMQVILGSTSVVDGISAHHFRAIERGGRVMIRSTSSEEPMLPVGGSLSATVDFLNGDLATTRARLDSLARTLVSQVNAQHRLGQTFRPDGTPVAAGDFFSPGDPDIANPPALLPVTARDIRLSDAVTASAANVAASAATPGVGQAAGPGNNEIALALAGFRTNPGTMTVVAADGTVQTTSFAAYYRTTASELGVQVRYAESAASVHQTLADQADVRRMSASGVNVDEELTTLMRAQQAYAAAAKIVTVADEMTRQLLEMF